MTQQRSEITKLSNENRGQREEMTQLRNENRQQRTEMTQLSNENRQQSEKMTQLRNESRQQRDDIDRLSSLYETKHDACGQPSTNTIQDPVHARVGESVTLQCATNQTITVLRGEYGRYEDDCTSGCCEPSVADCTELMAEINTEEWQNIKTSCDGETTCTYPYSGQIIEVCARNYTADYLNFVYHCTDFVGFSAYATSTQYPDAGDVVEFRDTYVNAGGGYDTATSTFTCPTTGFYYIYFSVNVYVHDDSSSDDDTCYIGIRQDGSIMATVS